MATQQNINRFLPLLENRIDDWKYNQRHEMQEIIPGLFLGPYMVVSKSEKGNLTAAGITHIVCVRQLIQIKANFPEDFIYLTLQIADSVTSNVMVHFPQVNEFILSCLRVGGKVLVHGWTGCSISATLVLAFLMMHCGLSRAQDALAYLQGRRYCISPSYYFINQLQAYEPMCQAQHMQNVIPSDQQQRRSVKRTLEEEEEEEGEGDWKVMRMEEEES